MLNVLIGLTTVIVYSLVCYGYCCVKVNGKLNLKLASGKEVYKDAFKYMWIAILILLVCLDWLGRGMQYIIGRLV